MFTSILFVIMLVSAITSATLAILSGDSFRIWVTCTSIVAYLFGCGAAGAAMDSIRSNASRTGRGTGDSDLDGLCVLLWPVSGSVFAGIIFARIVARLLRGKAR